MKIIWIFIIANWENVDLIEKTALETSAVVQNSTVSICR